MNNNLKRNLGIFSIRWWAAGAVYFFVGWGTPMGNLDSLIDIVFFLVLVNWIFTTLIINPSIKMLTNKGWHLSYRESTFMQRFTNRVLDLIVAATSVIGVTLFYQFINTSFNEEIYIPGEPLLFGLFYAIIASVLIKTIEWIRSKIVK